jgi:uncharacterized protein (DUF2235 family)
MPKNIVVFSDGTRNEGGGSKDTNVYKLFRMVGQRMPEQIAFYDTGVGTGWRKFTGAAGGRGLAQNVRECYEFIFNNYKLGDRIYLFGFSRGATTVRSLSGFIDLFGILPQSRPELIGQAYKIYKNKNGDQRNIEAGIFAKKHRVIWCKIKFLGVWDTVAALGMPWKKLDWMVDKLPFWKHKYHEWGLSESVSYGRQALSIDDDRKEFHPEYWDALKKDNEDDPRVKQVWFCGVHSDVGGGYEDHGLSDIALQWMVDEAAAKGLIIYGEHKVELKPNEDGEIHDPWEKWWTRRVYRKEVRAWNREDKPVIHHSVLARRNYEPWITKNRDYEIEK